MVQMTTVAEPRTSIRYTHCDPEITRGRNGFDGG